MTLSKLTLLQLKELAKNKKLRGYSKMKKAELLSLLRSPRKSPRRSKARSLHKSPRKSPRQTLSKLSVLQLKELAKNKKLRGYSKMKKAELLSLLRSPRRSKSRSPRKSPRRSKSRSPRKSPRRSKSRSPRKSPRRSKARSLRKSPRKSPRRSKAKSPRKSPRRSKAKSPRVQLTPKSPKQYKNQTCKIDRRLVGFDFINVEHVVNECIKDGNIILKTGSKPAGYGYIYTGYFQGKDIIVKMTDLPYGRKKIEKITKSLDFIYLEDEAKYYAYMGERDIGPKVYHIFNKFESDRVVQFIIMEKYDTDLFYYLINKTVSKEDKYEAISKMINIYIKAVNASPVPIICSDIKPSNFVINVSTKQVRMIDFSPIFCDESPLIALSKSSDSGVKRKSPIITRTQYEQTIKPKLNSRTVELINEYTYGIQDEYEKYLTFIAILLILVQLYVMIQKDSNINSAYIKNIFKELGKQPSWSSILSSLKTILDGNANIRSTFLNYTKINVGAVLQNYIEKNLL